MTEAAITWLVLWVILGFAAMMIWSSKGGSPGAGFVMGILLGFIGLIIAIAAKPKYGPGIVMNRECPHCRQQIPANASVCHFCSRESEPYTLKDGTWWIHRGDEWMYYNPKTNAWVLSNGAAKVTTSGF